MLEYRVDRSTGVTFETKDFKVTAACASGYTEMSGTSSDGTDEDDQGEACFSDSLPPRGIRSSRKRPKKERRQSPAWKNMKTGEVEKETLMLENGKNRAEVVQEETTQSLIPTPVRIVMFAIFVFVIFMHPQVVAPTAFSKKVLLSSPHPTAFKYLQGWGLNHFPGQPVPMLDNPFSEVKLPNIQSKPPLAQLEAISSGPMACDLGEETDPTSLQPPFRQL
ncbi:hypothetical protein QYF61_009385 [Mycteria americana]|uniref:Uncharacterized protein n=1 Tax=Mycteria americana TaxID=33587 RepID=A0AAN7MGB9_MYCAM|nr:hypothetical protein QYF61_009385 [Mycteria americana]